MDKIKKILKIGKIYRIEHETELRDRNYTQRKKDSKNQAGLDGWLKSFLIENSGLKTVLFERRVKVDRHYKIYGPWTSEICIS